MLQGFFIKKFTVFSFTGGSIKQHQNTTIINYRCVEKNLPFILFGGGITWHTIYKVSETGNYPVVAVE